MASKKESIKQELKDLIAHGRYLTYHEALKEGKLSSDQKIELNNMLEFKAFVNSVENTRSAYQNWYSKSCRVVNQLLPERVDEFKKLYINEKRTTKDITSLSYTISDYLLGLRITRGWEKEEVVDAFSAFYSKMELQIEIVNACLLSIDSKLLDIKGLLQAELFDSELDTAKDILRKKHTRLAGALAGITLEAHLKNICSNHSINFRKAHPTISDFNEELKKREIIDVPTWRLIQRLGDIRNLSVHVKEREPSADEVEDLIKGTEKLISELF